MKKRLLTVLGTLLAVSACSSDPPGEGGPTPCIIDDQCDGLDVCFAGFCADPSSVGDVADPDTATDATNDSGADVDPDAGDVPRDVDPDAGDTPQDTLADGEDGGEDAGDADGGGDTGDVGPDVPPSLDCDAAERNACGGCNTLALAGREFTPGEPCGPCGGGIISCDGPSSVRCTGGTPPNECSSCVLMPAPVGTECGVCSNGALACADTPLGVECADATTNACGGCAPLEGEPSAACDTGDGEGLWACTGADSLRCDVGSTATNVCGGEGELTYRGEPANPGDPCGPTFEGALVCDSADELDCSVEDPSNACGGRAALAGEPGSACVIGAACGAIDGSWQCVDDELAESLGIEAFDGVICIPDGARPENVCGGCDALTDAPGTPCGEDGVWICDGSEDVFCFEGGGGCDHNWCGGCDELPRALGESCGVCETGVTSCNGPNDVHCFGERSEDDALNACSGCGELNFDGRSAEPGDGCGVCGSGELACDGEEALLCEGDEGEGAFNECGGCGEIAGELGAICGTCDTGTLACAIGGNDAVCASDRGEDALNACGGCGEMEAIGEACGTCDSGIWACDGTAATCEGDLGDDAINQCGECGPALEAGPEDACGTCGGGTFTCAEDGLSLECEGDPGDEALNACGGCADLSGIPEDSCGTCATGTWTCSEDGESVTCEGVDDTLNGCGGCGPLDAEPTTPCGECGSGSWACGGSDAVFCVGDLGAAARNGCGGCAELPGPVDGACGVCDGGVYACDGEEAMACIGDTLEFNECGGCTEIPELGVACGSCDSGVLDCDGTEAVLCAGDLGDDALNECGGCTELDNPVGAGCGECGSGSYECAEDDESTECIGDAGPGATNACGGCGALAGPPLTACGTCDTGTWQCSGDLASVTCDGDAGPGALNECGGCTTLPEALDTDCGTCGSGSWACDGLDAVTCGGDLGEDARNSCDGCDALADEPGDACGTCGSGTFACDGSEAVSCEDDLGDDALNECGGCAALPGAVDEVCGSCSTQIYECDGTEALRCTTEVDCPICEDGVLNGDESDIDCGGSCPLCPIGGDCDGPSDCGSGVCDAGSCVAAASCEDGVENGDETGVDCGGPACEACPNGEGCIDPDDCVTGNCEVDTCYPEPTCDDGRANGLETDVDCGGGVCAGCPGFSACIVAADCGVAWDCIGEVCTPPAITNPWIAFIAPGSLGLDVVWLIRADGTGLSQLATSDIIQFDPAWSPDGRFLAYRTLGAPAPIRVVEMATGAVTTLNPGLTSWSSPTWSPHGDAVMVEGSTGGNSDLWVVPISGDAPYQMGVTAYSDSAPDWQHPGTVYLVQDELGVFEIYSRDTTTLEDTRLTVGTSILGGPDASWTAEFMAFVRRTSATTTQTVVWDVAAGTSVDIGSAESTSPAFYPNSDRLVVVDRSAAGLDIFVADAATGTLIQQVTSSADSESSLTVSPRESADIPFWLVP